MSNESYLDQHPLEKEAIETILAIGDEFINNIPEDIFVSRYLPMLANKDKELVDLSEWISVAGHVYAEVNVVKDGNVLFKVPSIMKRFKTKEHKHSSQSVREIIETSKLHSISSPKLGERMLEEGLTTTLPKEQITLDDNERWDQILKRYGYPTSKDGKVSEGKAQVTDVSRDDKIDFDDYDLA